MDAANILANYNAHDPARYGTPWVAIAGPDGRPDFSRRVGGYTGGYNTGNAGNLYVVDPVDGAVYVYGQKDHLGSNTYYERARYTGGRFEPA